MRVIPSPVPALQHSRRAVARGALGACLLVMAAGQQGIIAHGHTTNAYQRQRAEPTSFSHVPTARRMTALTFDDGPDPSYTPAVLDTLARFGVSATFFTIGRNALAHPELVRRAVAEGHEVANHTQDHLWLDQLDEARVAEEVDRCTASLHTVAAVRPAFFRAPRGWTSAVVGDVVDARRMRSAYWSEAVEAHRSMATSDAAHLLAARARPGSIILAHDGGTLEGPNPQHIDRSFTVDTLPKLLAGLERADLRASTLAALWAARDPT